MWLVTKSISGEISAEEKAEFDEIIETNPEFKARYQLIERFWKQETFSNQSSDADRALQKVLTRINEKPAVQKKGLVVSLWGKVAAAAMIVFACAAGLYYYDNITPVRQEIVFVEKYNARGIRSVLTLTDGTRIWLNSDSKIGYPEKFANDVREVHLSGEAFFDVAKDTKKPFIIHTDDAAVRVLGTSFNVKAYSNEDRVQTSVVSGKVAFIPKANGVQNDTLLLTKSHKVTYTATSGEIKTEITNTEDDREWINGKHVYKAETLALIGKRLERTFNKKVLIRNPKLAEQRFTATFEDSSLKEIMYYLSMTSQFKYSITDSTLVIY